MPLAATVCSNMLTPAVCDPQFNTSCDVPPPNMLAPAVFGNKWETGLFLGKACSRLKKEKSIQTAVRQCLGQHWAYPCSCSLTRQKAKHSTLATFTFHSFRRKQLKSAFTALIQLHIFPVTMFPPPLALAIIACTNTHTQCYVHTNS